MKIRETLAVNAREASNIRNSKKMSEIFLENALNLRQWYQISKNSESQQSDEYLRQD